MQEDKIQLASILDDIGRARLKVFFHYDQLRAHFYLKNAPQDTNLLKYYDDEHLKKLLEGLFLLKSKACVKSHDPESLTLLY